MMPWRKLLLKIHLYSGLVCFWYLIILGTSSLNFNHQFSFMDRSEKHATWTRSIRLANNFPDDLQLSEAIRDSLALIGWPLPWETWHDSTGNFHFALEHPGKRYVIDFAFHTKEAKVTEHTKGFWVAFNNLHGSGAVPNSIFMYSWKWYTRITVVLVIFSVFAGIYLWFEGRRDKKTGWYILVTSALISSAWMLHLYFKG